MEGTEVWYRTSEVRIQVLIHHDIIPFRISQFTVSCKHTCTHTHTFSFHFALFGEGNGTPLQYSCLENPMDGGAW